jgi:hypothetical protein
MFRSSEYSSAFEFIVHGFWHKNTYLGGNCRAAVYLAKLTCIDETQESIMEHSKSVFWLKIASGLTVGFGLMIAATALPALAGPTRFFADLIFFPLDGAQDLSDPALRLVSAICGGVMAGWGVLLWLVATRILPRDPMLARQMVLTSLFTWFAIDSLGSLASGGGLNVLGNIAFLLIFIVPALRISGPSAASA